MSVKSIELSLKGLDGTFVPCQINVGTAEFNTSVDQAPILNSPKFLYVYLSQTAYQVLNSHWQHKQKITWLLEHDPQLVRYNTDAQQAWLDRDQQEIHRRYEEVKKQFIDAQMATWISTGIFSFQKSDLDNLLENEKIALEQASRSNDIEAAKHWQRILWLVDNEDTLKDQTTDEQTRWTEANKDHQTKGRDIKELYEASLKANAIAKHRVELESHYALTDIFFWPAAPGANGNTLSIPGGLTLPLTQDMAYGMVWSENLANANAEQMQAVAEQIAFLSLHFENAQFRDDSPRSAADKPLSAGELAAGRGPHSMLAMFDLSNRTHILNALARVQSAMAKRSLNIEMDARALEVPPSKWKRRLIIAAIVVFGLIALTALFATPAWLGLLGVGGAGGALATFGVAMSHIIPPAIIAGVAITTDALIGLSVFGLVIYAISKCIGFCRSCFSRKETGYRAVVDSEGKGKDRDYDLENGRQLNVLSTPDERNVFDDGYVPPPRAARRTLELESGDALQVVRAQPKPLYVPSLAPRPAPQPKQTANSGGALRSRASAHTESSTTDKKGKKEKKFLKKPEGSGRSSTSTSSSTTFGAASVSGTAAFSNAPVPHPQTFVPASSPAPAPALAPASTTSSSARAISSAPAPTTLQPVASSPARAISSAPAPATLPVVSSPAAPTSAPAPTPAVTVNGQGTPKKSASSTATPPASVPAASKTSTSSAPKPPASSPVAPKEAPKPPAKAPALAASKASTPPPSSSSDSRSGLLAEIEGDPIAVLRAKKAAKEKAEAERKAAAERTSSVAPAASPDKPKAPVGQGAHFKAAAAKPGAGGPSNSDLMGGFAAIKAKREAKAAEQKALEKAKTAASANGDVVAIGPSILLT